MTLYYSNAEDVTQPEVLLKNLSNINEATFNLTSNTIRYNNLYEGEITIKKVAYNLIHPIVYTIIVEINTLIPLAVYVASGKHALLLTKLIILWLAVSILFLIPAIIKSIFIIYFFIKEKKRTKDKWWH